MASHSRTNAPAPRNTDPDNIEPDSEEEVDQLDSEEGSTTGNSNGKPEIGGGTRTPGETLLPAVRIENIIQADGVTGNLALSKEGLFVLSIATEEFIKRLTLAGLRQANAGRRNSIAYKDMSASIHQYQELMFLKETIPITIPLSEALELRAAREQELQQDDPAMISVSGNPHPQPPNFGATKSKGKHRATNGQERANGHASTASSSRHMSEDDNYDESGMQRTSTNGSRLHWTSSQPQSSRLASAPARSSPLANGNNVISSRSGTVTPAGQIIDDYPSPPHHSHYHRPSHSQEDPATWQYTGPSSAFLQGPGAPFGRASNPGRTIYSQQNRTD
ncbi:hypothetical protein BDN72DRAFT_637296 [Pluteus cervinus]|uniref:Uncharacterized protein n=1 Tax=Pluteus cervinus TaxID=181527 RepID=A0ACD3BB62_9AGAR|nr:hypothetical protein BDN72DRAFT_637296 [Pluteus cervinus]